MLNPEITNKENIKKRTRKEAKNPEIPAGKSEISGLSNLPITEIAQRLTGADSRTSDQVLELIEAGKFSKADLFAEQYIKTPIPSKVRSEVAVKVKGSAE